MNDTQFDDYFNDKLKDHAAPVPAGLWEKVVEGQLDQFIGNKLKDSEAPVPNDLWGKITDAQFDNFIGDKLHDNIAPVPAGLWDNIQDGQFDQFVAGKLIDHESPVPAGLWEKVRPEEDDDRKGFFWFRYPAAAVLLLGVLVAGSVGAYLLFHSQKGIPAVNSGINSSKTNNAPAAKSQNKIPGQETPKASDQTNDHTSVVPPVANDSKAVPDATAIEQGKNGTNAEAERAAAEANNHLRIADQTSHLNTSARANRNAAGNPSSLVPRNLSNPSSLPANKAGTSLPPADAGNNNTATLSDPYDPFKNNKAAIDKVNERSSTNAASSDDNNIDMQLYQHNLLSASTVPSLIGPYNLSQSALDKQLIANHTNQFKSVIICPSDRKNHNTDLFVEAYLSPDIALKSVSNVSASQQYIARKDSSENMQVGFSAGIRLVKPITENILIKAGVQYSQMNEKYVYRTENEVKTTTVVTVRTIIRAPGDTVIVKDTSTVQTVGFRNNTVKNRYRSFDIPITVGYQFGNDDLKFGVNAGVVVNLSSWYQGVILDSSLATVTLNKNGNNVYKSSVGLGLYGGFSIVKRLGEDMHVFVEPYFRYNLSNMTTSQSSYNQKFSLGGVSIGLRLNLNRK